MGTGAALVNRHFIAIWLSLRFASLTLSRFGLGVIFGSGASLTLRVSVMSGASLSFGLV
jgi:hypothetical protein